MKVKVLLIILILSFQAIAGQEDCPSGKYYDATLNRCLTTQQAQEVKTATIQCMQQQDEASRKACYIQYGNMKLAESGKQGVDESYISEKFIDGNANNKKGITNAAIASAIALYGIIFVMPKIKQCKSTALWFMLGGAVSAAGSELSSWLIYKNGLKKLEEEYASLAKSSTDDPTKMNGDQQRIEATEAQEKAFEYLAKKEMLVRKVALVKGSVYALAGAMYTAAAVISAVELVRMSTSYGADQSGVCPGTAKGGGEKIAADSMVGRLGKALFGFVNPLKGTGYTTSGEQIEEGKRLGSKGESVSGFKGAIQGIGKMLVHPTVRMVASGIFAANAIKLSVYAFKQAKLAKERAAYLETLKAEFAANGGIVNCTPEQRNIPDPNNITCYCYTEDYQKNENRQNSAVCQKYWNENYTRVADSTNYDELFNPYSAGGAYGCVNRQNQFDEKCGCRKQILKNGENNCFKVQPGVTGIGSIGNAKWVKELASTSDSLTNGSKSAASLNAGDLVKKAHSLNQLKDKFVKKKVKKKNQDKLKKLADSTQAAFDKYVDVAAKTFPKLSGGTTNSLASSSSLAPSLDEKVGDDFKMALDGKMNVGAKSLGKGKKFVRNGGDGFDFSLGDGKGGVKIENNAGAAAMAQTYDYGNNDINKDNGASIFELLSNRYQVSGLRRLFDNGLVPQEKQKVEKVPVATP